MSFRQKLDALYARNKFEYFGIAGSIITAGCMIVASIGYASYSILNHAISELGMVTASPLAIVFNVGLIAGGLVFLFFIGGMRAALDSRLARLSRVLGCITAIGTALVGVFPADVNLWGHIIAAETFFIGGLFMVLGFSVAILRQADRKIGKGVAWVGFIVVAIFGIFVVMLQISMASFTGGSITALPEPRDAFIPLTFFEWLVYFGVIAWLCLFAIDSLRKRK